MGLQAAKQDQPPHVQSLGHVIIKLHDKHIFVNINLLIG